MSYCNTSTKYAGKPYQKRKKYISDNDRSRIPWERRRMFGRQKMLNRAKRKATTEEKKNYLDEEIQDVENEIVQHIKMERMTEERRVIESMDDKPKVFHAYVRSQNERREGVGPFKENGAYISDNKKMGEMLTSQYKSQMNENTIDKEREEIEYLLNDIREGDLVDIEVAESTIIESIKDLNENSSAGSDDVPAIFMTKTKFTVAKPLKIILRKSIDEGKVPDVFKMANITPIHKGGAKTKPENYRPISLTSHCEGI